MSESTPGRLRAGFSGETAHYQHKRSPLPLKGYRKHRETVVARPIRASMREPLHPTRDPEHWPSTPLTGLGYDDEACHYNATGPARSLPRTGPAPPYRWPALPRPDPDRVDVHASVPGPPATVEVAGAP